MPRKIKLGWNSGGRFADALDIGFKKVREEIEETYGSDFDLPYKYEGNDGIATLILKGQLLKISGKGLSYEMFHNIPLNNVSLRWMMYKGRIFTYAFLQPQRQSGRLCPFVFMARKPLNMKTKNIILDDITSVWRRIH